MQRVSSWFKFMVLGAPLVMAASAWASPYAFTVLDVPGASGTVANDIDSAGHVVGTFVDAKGAHGFRYDGTTFDVIDVPGASLTYAWGLNDAGDVVGVFDNASGRHAFLLRAGIYETVDYPGAALSAAWDIDNAGRIVGGFNTVSGVDAHGFMKTGSTFESIEVPGFAFSEATAINDIGQVIGDAWTSYPSPSTTSRHGYVMTGGVVSLIDFPGAPITDASGINNGGAIVGSYADAAGLTHGFLETGSTFATVDVPFANTGTGAYGIDNSGRIVGAFSDATGNHGFVASPVPEPASLAILITGLGVLLAKFGRRRILRRVLISAAGCRLLGGCTLAPSAASRGVPMTATTRRMLALVLSLAGSVASAQMPPELAQQLIAIGPVINPAATAALYAPRVAEKEPYANVGVERDVAYGPDERNLLDVFVPAGDGGKARPVLVFVHGGAFVGGNRRTGPGSPFYDNVMLWAVRHGMVGVNMTYRLAPKNAWPSGAQDIGQAINWIRDNIARRGGDPARVYLFGHSAGASHVASYVARPEFHRVAGSGLAGAMLLSGAYRITPELVSKSPTYAGYFGTDVDKYAQRSSLDGLLASRVPLWVGSAELDPPQFKEQADLLREGLRKAGTGFQTAVFAGHSHMSEAYSIHSDDRSVGDALMAFVSAR